MRRTEVLQGLRRMKFEAIYGRWRQRRLSQAEAAEILGMSERTFRRWRERYDADGLEGLLDRRLGKASARRVPVDQVDQVLTLYRELYGGFTVRHFHDKLRQHHGFRWGYTWTKLRLQAAGLITKAPRRSAHRKKRPRRPLAGMLLHQDGSPHRWLPALDAQLDLIVTLDDATSAIYSAFLVDEEGTMSTFRALAEVIAAHGLPCALYTDRASHYFVTPKAGEKVAQDQLTQVGRALAQLELACPRAGRAGPGGAHPGLLARGAGPLRAGLWHAAGPPAQGAGACRHHHGRGRQPVHPRGLSARAQRRIRRGARAARDSVRGRCRRRPCRHSLRAGGARGRQRQHRALPGPELADPAQPDPTALRQGAGPRERLPGRHARDLPRAPLPCPLPGRRQPARP